MTETTSIQQFARERHAYAPVVQRPGLATFIAQAAIGSFCGTFAVMLGRILFVYHSYNGYFIFYLPFLMGLGLATGLVAGFLIWAATKEADGQLLTITRSLIGVLVTALAWFALWYFLLTEGNISLEAQVWLLLGVAVSGVSIGVMTGSRLRPWRELVRGGETKTTALKILAGLIGLVLRSVVVFLFLSSLIVAISMTQLYFLDHEQAYKYVRLEMVCYLLLLGHFSIGVVILFARMRFWSLVLLTVISSGPVVATLWLPGLNPPQEVVIGYLGVWALFLVTRWRQMDVAVGALNEELRYYLID
jgi:hypothetical protein